MVLGGSLHWIFQELSTTQIYAKVLDKNKQAAVAKIPDIF